MNDLNSLLDQLWNDYRRMNGQVDRIHQLLTSRGETVFNDHIALRTYDDPRVGLDVLAKCFLDLGYTPGEDYVFEAKKLRARHFEPPTSEAGKPRVFISELQLAKCSAQLGDIVTKLVDQVDEATRQRPDLPASGRPWQLSYDDYKLLADESEYAGWMAAFGFRANHFTVYVNALKSFSSLEELNAFLKESGFALNASGGEIKGSPQTYLEQSSTLADVAPVEFSDATHDIPCCYYEFARRYEMPNGELFSGFVAKSADKIFESTDRQDK